MAEMVIGHLDLLVAEHTTQISSNVIISSKLSSLGEGTNIAIGQGSGGSISPIKVSSNVTPPRSCRKTRYCYRKNKCMRWQFLKN